MSTERMTSEQYREYLRTGRMPANSPTVCAPDRKPGQRHAEARPVQSEADSPRFDSIDVQIHVIRKRSVDRDATRIKPVLDGIVRGGLVKDDSEDEIKTVRVTQEKGSEEKTIITVIPTADVDGAVIYGTEELMCGQRWLDTGKP